MLIFHDCLSELDSLPPSDLFIPDVNFYDCLDSLSAADFTSTTQTMMISSSIFPKGEENVFLSLRIKTETEIKPKSRIKTETGIKPKSWIKTETGIKPRSRTKIETDYTPKSRIRTG